MDLNIPSKYEKKVLCIARISPQKNLDLFLRIAQEMPEVAFVWIGNQNEIQNNLENVFFLGNIPNAGEFNKYVDLFVLTSNYEGLPMVIIEAMSYGKPIVASNVGGINEIVRNGINGYVVENSVDVFVDRIKEILYDDGKIKLFGMNSLRIFEEELTIENMVEGYKSIYMKVLQLGKFWPLEGGVEKVMYDLMTGLSNRQISCDMLCASTNMKYHEIRLNDYSTIYAMPSITRKFGTMISPKLISRLRKIASNYNIIHIHHPDPMAALALCLSGYKGRVIVHWHSDILKQKNLLKLIMPLQNWLLKRADIIIGTTPVYVKESPHLKDFQNKITYIPIGIKSIECSKNRVQEIRNLYRNKKIVFSLGRLVEYKGFEYLIKAANELPEDYIILIGGTGPLEQDLSSLIFSLNLQEKVKLLGRITDEDLPNYYAACDLFCLSSVRKTEAFAIVQIEAMSLGKPIVATKIPHSGVSWVNADGVSGLNVEIKNPKALSDAILSIGGNPLLYKKLSLGATARFNELFTFDKMIDNCQNIYKKVV